MTQSATFHATNQKGLRMISMAIHMPCSHHNSWHMLTYLAPEQECGAEFASMNAALRWQEPTLLTNTAAWLRVEEEAEGEDEDQKESSDNEPENDQHETLERVKRIPRRSLWRKWQHMCLAHTSHEKMKIIPNMTEDNLESCMTKTQELIQDTINSLF